MIHAGLFKSTHISLVASNSIKQQSKTWLFTALKYRNTLLFDLTFRQLPTNWQRLKKQRTMSRQVEILNVTAAAQNVTVTLHWQTHWSLSNDRPFGLTHMSIVRMTFICPTTDAANSNASSEYLQYREPLDNAKVRSTRAHLFMIVSLNNSFQFLS